MRLTKKFCALVSSLAVGATVQTPAPAQDTPAADENKLRDALRKALQTDTPTPAEGTTRAPAAPTTPVAPTAPVTPVPFVPLPNTNFVYQSGPTLVTNVTTNGVSVQLSLRQAIELALIRNLQIQVERYNPILAQYTYRGLYGVYDPVFNSGYTRNHATRETGGFNPNTGSEFPGTESDIDTYSAGLTGYLPTGLRYDLGHEINRVEASSFEDTGNTNRFGQPIFELVNRRTYSSVAAVTGTQPLLRNSWIDTERLQIRVARQAFHITELEYERLIMDVINRVEQGYYDLIAARELIKVGEADVAVKRQFFNEQRRRVEVGTLAPLEEKLAQAELALAEITLIAYRRDAGNFESVLKGLINDNFISHLNTRLELTDRLLALPDSDELYDALKEAVEKRPDLQAERVRLEQQRIQLKFTFNQLFPSLDVFGTYGANGLDRHLSGALDDISNRNFPQHSYGLALSFPLAMHSERQAHKRAKNAVEQQILAFKQLEETIIQEVETQLRILRSHWVSIPLRREQSVYQQAALEAEQKKVVAGKSTSFEVLSIASALTGAQANEIGTLRDYNKALSELSFRKGTTLDRWRIDRPRRSIR